MPCTHRVMMYIRKISDTQRLNLNSPWWKWNRWMSRAENDYQNPWRPLITNARSHLILPLPRVPNPLSVCSRPCCLSCRLIYARPFLNYGYVFLRFSIFSCFPSSSCNSPAVVLFCLSLCHQLLVISTPFRFYHSLWILFSLYSCICILFRI